MLTMPAYPTAPSLEEGKPHEGSLSWAGGRDRDRNMHWQQAVLRALATVPTHSFDSSF